MSIAPEVGKAETAVATISSRIGTSMVS